MNEKSGAELAAEEIHQHYFERLRWDTGRDKEQVAAIITKHFPSGDVGKLRALEAKCAADVRAAGKLAEIFHRDARDDRNARHIYEVALRKMHCTCYGSGEGGVGPCQMFLNCDKQIAKQALDAALASVPANPPQVGGEFYNGIEWLGAWLVDHAEGETVAEEHVRQWCVEAWREHVKRQPNNPPQVDTTLEALAEQAALKLRLLPVGALNAERYQIVLDALTSAHARKSQPSMGFTSDEVAALRDKHALGYVALSTLQEFLNDALDAHSPKIATEGMTKE